jgi:hypothetical protein
MGWQRIAWAAASGYLAVACSGTISSVDTERLGTGANEGVRADAAGAGATAGSAGRVSMNVGGFMTAGASAGGANASDGGEAGGSTIVEAPAACDAVTRVLVPKCGGGSCHSNERATIGDFAIGRVQAEAMLDRPASELGCGLIIDSADSAESLLLTKVNGTYPSDCGGPMPAPAGREERQLTVEDIDCLASWLKQFER